LKYFATICGCTLRITHDLLCACKISRYSHISGSIPLSCIHVHWKMLSISCIDDACDFWGDLTLTNEVDALLKKRLELDVVRKMTLKDSWTYISRYYFNVFPSRESKKTNGAAKFMKSTKCGPSMWEWVNEMNTMIDSLGTPSVALKDVSNNKRTKKNVLYGWIFQSITTVHRKKCWCET